MTPLVADVQQSLKSLEELKQVLDPASSKILRVSQDDIWNSKVLRDKLKDTNHQLLTNKTMG